MSVVGVDAVAEFLAGPPYRVVFFARCGQCGAPLRELLVPRGCPETVEDVIAAAVWARWGSQCPCQRVLPGANKLRGQVSKALRSRGLANPESDTSARVRV